MSAELIKAFIKNSHDTQYRSQDLMFLGYSVLFFLFVFSQENKIERMVRTLFIKVDECKAVKLCLHKLKFLLKKEKHKQTLMSPNIIAKLQVVDHVQVSSRNLNKVKGERSFRGPGINFDHFLIYAMIKVANKRMINVMGWLKTAWVKKRLKGQRIRLSSETLRGV